VIKYEKKLFSNYGPYVLILISFGLGAYFFPQMPDKMASHWNIKGEADGYMSKFWGLFLMPIISLGLFLPFLLISKIDPLKANIEKFREYFDGFIVLIMVFLFLYLSFKHCLESWQKV